MSPRRFLNAVLAVLISISIPFGVQAKGKPGGLPSQPTGVVASAVSCSQVNIAWIASTDSQPGNNSGIASYAIYRNNTFLKTVPGAMTSTTDTSVSQSTTYTYTVTATNNAGNGSAQSSPASATTPACCTATISTSSSPSAGGSTSGGTTVPCGTTVTVTASANSGYTFAYWTQNGVVVSTSASYAFTANGSESLVANFTPVGCSDTISVSATTGGTASGGGSVSCGSSVTVTATPNSCYSFLDWTQNGVVVSSSASYTFTANANVALVANFAPETYTVSTSASTGGSASGGGTVNCGSSVTVTASPRGCYLFANWTVNGVVVSTSESYSFIPGGSETVVANFTAIDYTIGTSASAGGTASGGGTAQCGSSVTVTATPDSCYQFVNWTVNGAVVSTSASYTFIPGGSETLVANFAAATVTISTSVSPAGSGTASGGGTVNCGSSVTVSASAAAGYTFANWTLNGAVVSTSASYTFTASASQTLVANFSAAACNYTLSPSSASPGAAAGSGTVTVTTGSSCSWTASSGASWITITSGSSGTGSGTVGYSVSANTSTSERTGNMTIAGQTFTVTQSGASDTTPPDAPTGVIATALSCSNVNLSWNPATDPDSGIAQYAVYRNFALVAYVSGSETSWVDTAVSPLTTYTYNVSATDPANNTSGLSTNATATTPSCSSCTATIGTSSSPSAGGTTSGGTTVACGTSVTVNASANAGYTFAEWTLNGAVVSTSASYTFTANGSESLVANFTPVACTDTISVSATTGGTASGGGSVSCGSSVTVTAAANAGYTFSNWTLNGVVVSTSASYTFTANSSESLVANFASAPCTDTISVSATTGGTAGGGGSVNCGSSVTVTATPNSCYSFLYWTQNGVVVSSSASYNFTANASVSLVANFAPITYTVSTSASTGGSASGGGTVNCGSSVTVTATPSSCHQFANWTVNGVVVSTAASYTFTPSASETVVANFSAITYTISTSASAGGTASGGGTVNCGSSVTVTATPSSCYQFANWTVNGAVVSTSASYTFTPSGSESVMANFAPVTDAISTSVSPAGSGTASGGGTVNCGSSVTVTASAAAGYTFANWTLNGAVVSTSASYTFTASASQSLVANFTATACNYTLSPSSASPGAAAGSGTVTVTTGSSCSWTASSGASWITITSGSSGTGNGTVGYSVAANASSSSRSGSLTIAGHTFTVTQAGDTTPPTVPTGVSATAVSCSQVSVSWNASTDSISGVKQYNVYRNGVLLTIVTAPTTSAPDTTVSASTTYSYTVSATDNAGNTSAQSTAGSVTTPACAPPTVSLTSPTSGATVSNTITVSANASDSQGITHVDFYYDSGVLIASDTTSPYTANFDTTTITNGSHKFFAKAYDTVGNSTISSTNAVTVSNGTGVTPPPLGQLAWLEPMLALNGNAYVTGIGNDSSGNVIIVGYFNGTVNFGTVSMTSVSASTPDAFVVKFGSTGTVMWAKQLGGAGSDAAEAVAIDSQNNIIVMGNFQDSVDFGGGAIAAGSTYEMFVVKYSPSGGYVWGGYYPGIQSDVGNVIAIDKSDNVVVAMDVGYNGNFGGVPLSAVGGAADYDIGIGKISGTTGATIWAKRYGGVNWEFATGVALDGSGNVAVTGYFQTSTTLGGPTLVGPGSYNVFLAEYSGTDGSYRWSRGMAGSGGDRGYGVAADPNTGNVVVVGGFSGAVDFGGGATGNSGVFYAGYDSNGNYLWANTTGGSGDYASAVSIDAHGNLAITGRSAAGLIFNGVTYLFGNGQDNFFVASFTLTGNSAPSYKWAKYVGSGTAGASQGGAINLGPNELFVGGSFMSTLDFGGISATAGEPGYSSGFTAKYGN